MKVSALNVDNQFVFLGHSSNPWIVWKATDSMFGFKQIFKITTVAASVAIEDGPLVEGKNTLPEMCKIISEHFEEEVNEEMFGDKLDNLEVRNQPSFEEIFG